MRLSSTTLLTSSNALFVLFSVAALCITLLLPVHSAHAQNAVRETDHPAQPLSRRALTTGDLLLRSSVSLQTTYVFRGIPQYNDEEVPSLQLATEGEYLLSSSSRLWGLVWIGVPLSERELDEAFSSTDEIDLALGYTHIQGDKTFRVGAITYLRPGDDVQLDIRDEVLAQFHWTVFQDDDGLMVTPFAEVYGEYLRARGIYGRLGLQIRRELGYDFLLGWNLAAGASTYSEEDAQNFNAIASAVELVYGVRRDWAVAGRLSLAFTNDVTEIDPDFIEEHGVFWSGFTVTYRPRFKP